MTLRRNINLDELVQDINNWQQQIDELWETYQKAEIDLKSMRRECENSEMKEKNALEDSMEMHKLVDKLQGILATRCNIEDENRTLKEQIGNLKNNIAQMTKEYGDKENNWEEEKHSIIEKHKNELANAIEATRTEMKKEITLLEKNLEEKTQCVRSLQKQVGDAEKAKHTEIVKLKLEYDAKISRLQKQATKAQQAGNRNTSSNSDIFRQKLKFAKESSDKEISALKRTITELERKVSNQQMSKKKKF